VRRRGLKGRLGCYLHDMTYENKREKDRERDDDDGGVCLGVRALVFVETIPLINSQLSTLMGRGRGCFPFPFSFL
jgi:hypothetical protein